jgi:hypothetical protein
MVWAYGGYMGRAWSAPELEVFARRVKIFVKEGLNEEEAEGLAEAMLVRDAEGDDRRVCFECTKYQPAKVLCSVYRKRPLRFTLQRCEFFDLRGKK